MLLQLVAVRGCARWCAVMDDVSGRGGVAAGQPCLWCHRQGWVAALFFFRFRFLFFVLMGTRGSAFL